MTASEFTCPHCTASFEVDCSQAVQQVQCPICDGLIAIPNLLPATQPSEMSSAEGLAEPALPMDLTKLACPNCSGVFQVGRNAAGQQCTCPHCANLVMIPGAIPDEVSTIDAPGPIPSSGTPGLTGAPQTSAPESFAATSHSEGTVGPSGDSDSAASLLPPSDDQIALDQSSHSLSTKRQATDVTSSPAESDDPNPLLPPSVNEFEETSREARQSTESSETESLLPPAVSSFTSESEKRVGEVSGQPSRVNEDSGFIIPTEDGGEVTLREPVKVVGHGTKAVELRRLSADEKAKRKTKRNILMLVICAAMMGLALAIVWNFGPRDFGDHDLPTAQRAIAAAFGQSFWEVEG